MNGEKFTAAPQIQLEVELEVRVYMRIEAIEMPKGTAFPRRRWLQNEAKLRSL